MKYLLKKIVSLFFTCGLIGALSQSQAQDVTSYVDPFIGTATSAVYTKWGDEGGTYPGAVAPSGYIQLSPETHQGGYDYSENEIRYFSCFNHSSGFPGGSGGSFFLMPINNVNQEDPVSIGRKFNHTSEAASPGFYRVQLADDKTTIETTVLERVGAVRIIYPVGVATEIFIGDAGMFSYPSNKIMYASNHNAIMVFSEPYVVKRKSKTGVIITFDLPPSANRTLVVKISGSSIDHASSQKNIDAEKSKSFDEMETETKSKWNHELSVIEIDDSNMVNKKKFYTALYHSLLIPWIISDADGKYRGADGQIHLTHGKFEYGKFSPWDTYRTLHPLLSLLFPEKERDIIASILDTYKQTGYLPTESMTGNHVIEIIVDAYMKNIIKKNEGEFYSAMKKQIETGPFIQPDLKIYFKKGYIPFTYPESVTRTVEYAYDDWALSQFAKDVMNRNTDYTYLATQSNNYINLFYADSMFLLPRDSREFLMSPGNMGYKEGDKWVYTYSVPFNANNLVNMLGGDKEFAGRLNEGLETQQIVFDNETVFHVPYLFNFARREDLSQYWIRNIIDMRFADSPGGLPGNDDLGAISSWFVWSALGIYPFCPGTAHYSIGTPLFKKATIHLPNTRTFVIKGLHSGSANGYVQSLFLNGTPWKQLSFAHFRIVDGGEMVFDMSSRPSVKWFDKEQDTVFCRTITEPHFTLGNFRVSGKKFFPDQKVVLHFSIKNSGANGTRVVRLYVNNKELCYKNCYVPANSGLKDSVSFQLYNMGLTDLVIDSAVVAGVEVVKPSYAFPDQPKITELTVKPVVRSGTGFPVNFHAQNIGGQARTFFIPLKIDDKVALTDSVYLLPGETKFISQKLYADKDGLRKIEIGENIKLIKVINCNRATLILNLPLIGRRQDAAMVKDLSGFNNNGAIICNSSVTVDSLLLSNNCYVQVSNSYSVDNIDSSITLMAWIYTEKSSPGLTDMITKGDNDVLQLSNGRQLTFFAGGWGRGNCTVDLPEHWLNHWHHIAGVCNGTSLKVYIDGEVKGTTQLRKATNLSNISKWTIGRNQEFPDQRIFAGYIDKVKVFAAALSNQEVVEEMNESIK